MPCLRGISRYCPGVNTITVGGGRQQRRNLKVPSKTESSIWSSAFPHWSVLRGWTIKQGALLTTGSLLGLALWGNPKEEEQILFCRFPRSSQVICLHRELCLPTMPLSHPSSPGIGRIRLLPVQNRHYILESSCHVHSTDVTCFLKMLGWIERTKTFGSSPDNILPCDYYCLAPLLGQLYINVPMNNSKHLRPF